jgi:hypothetical protein
MTGSTEMPLHANKFGGAPKDQHIEAVSEFFQVHPFYRFGAILTAETRLTGLISFRGSPAT